LGVCFSLIPIVSSAADADNPLTVPGAVRPEIHRAPGEVFQLPPVIIPSTPSSGFPTGTKVRFDRVVFRGNTVFSSDELEVVAAPYLRREVGASELEELRQKLTRHYVDRGYVNSGALLASDTGGGQVVFDVIEGRLTGVRVAGMERLNEDYVVRRLVRDVDGPLNLELLRERFALLLGDPLFARMNGRLTPGERPGEAFFDVEAVRARPYQLRASLNNYRPPSIGSQTLALNGWVRNLTGYGDQLEAGLQTSTEHSHGTRSNVAWRVPLGYSGTQMSVAFDSGVSSVIEEPTSALGITSKLTGSEVGISQTLFEGLQHKLMIGVDRVKRQNDTFLLGIPFSFNPGEPNGVTKERLWRFWQDYSYRTETSVLALRSTFTSGKNNLEIVPGLPSSNSPKSRFNVWLGQAQYAYQVSGAGAQVVGRITAQRTGDRLLALDGISIGGVNSVRGFRENQLVRDEGAIVNLEFEYPVLRGSGSGFSATVIPFYDHGQGSNKAESAERLSSWGLASRIRWKGFSLDVVLAKRLVSPVSAGTNRSTLQDKGVHVQLSLALF
jgi:hemolysin activation/secretion protein